ncbi:BrnT family toxin [Pseudoroseomonas sp. WGS1072]|uniref:BrnT family toxin n=1 Tax=Roseomonas sp. WGS1072 TaxID=3366816 RepID=UPI003BF2A61D
MWINGDAAKEERNLRERKLPFLLMVALLENLIAEWEDTRHDYGETRMIAVGLVGGRLMVGVYTMREEAREPVVWVISLRKANSREQAQWLG